jgi:hypothetical protein
MDWTTGWNDKGIGFAASRDLTTWTEQRFLRLMEDMRGPKLLGAGNVFMIRGAGDYIFLVVDVEGRFPETVSPHRMNNRTYYVTTKDFETFTKPQILFNPGFDNIDATIVRHNDQYILTIKEGDMQQRGVWGPIHQAIADDPRGPYKLLDKPALVARAEGPTVGRIGEAYVMYVDYYVHGRYGALKTQDFKTWTDISDKVNTVSGQRHGTLLTIPRATAEGLKTEAARTRRRRFCRGIMPIRISPCSATGTISTDDRRDGGMGLDVVLGCMLVRGPCPRQNHGVFCGWASMSSGPTGMRGLLRLRRKTASTTFIRRPLRISALRWRIPPTGRSSIRWAGRWCRATNIAARRSIRWCLWMTTVRRTCIGARVTVMLSS